MSDIDKTRDNINIGRLKENERKQLFDKFIDSGGKVVRKKRKAGVKIDRTKQREFSQKMDSHYRKNRRSGASGFQRTGARGGSADSSAATARRKKNFISRFVDRIIIGFKLKFLGVSDFHGYVFKSKFLNKMDVDYKTALMELQMLYLDIFKQFPHKGTRISEKLDSMKPIYVELIEMSADFFDRTNISQILDNYLTFPDEQHKILDSREPILDLFKKIYMLLPYQTQILFSFQKAIDLQMRINKDKPADYAAKKKKVKNNIYIIYNKLFPRLYWLFCSFQGEIITTDDMTSMELALNITDDMRPGNRVAYSTSSYTPGVGSETPSASSVKEKASEEEGEKKEEKKPSAPKLPEEIKRGLMLITRLNMEELRNKYITNESLRNIVDSDRVLIAYLLFREFDNEYTFLLTTNKIKFNVFFNNRGKVDYREKLTDLYDDMRKPVSAINEYFDSLEVYEEAREEKPTTNDQYYQYTKRLARLEQEKGTKGSEAIFSLRQYMENLSDTLSEILVDMDGENKIVNNPQDVLKIDPGIEGHKKLADRKVYHAISIVNDFCSAFAYRLSSSGDLLTPGSDSKRSARPAEEKPGEDKKPNQKKPGQIDQIEKNQAEKNEPEKDKPSSGSGGDGDSILGELDDLI